MFVRKFKVLLSLDLKTILNNFILLMFYMNCSLLLSEYIISVALVIPLQTQIKDKYWDRNEKHKQFKVRATTNKNYKQVPILKCLIVLGKYR